jgi:AraC-like DNA-binding protein
MPMTENFDEIILVNSLADESIPKDYMQNYFTHILCLGGSGQFRINDKLWTIKKDELVILLPKSKIYDLMFTPDFQATILLVSFDLMSKNNPDIGWGIKGYLFSQENPVVSLGQENAERCKNNIHLLFEKYIDFKHRFRSEIINLQLKLFILEMWNMLAAEMEKQIKNNEKNSLFQRFLQLVQLHCMEQREVEYYASELCISPKYLSEVCKKSSGKNASEWIQNYTTTRLILLLRNEHLSLNEIADSMNFSSQSFFSRYVKKVLGVSPREYRAKLL